MPPIFIVNLEEFIGTLSDVERKHLEELYGEYIFNAVSTIAGLYIDHIVDAKSPTFIEDVRKDALAKLEPIVDDFHNTFDVRSLNADIVADMLTRGVEAFHKQYGSVIGERYLNALVDTCVVEALPIGGDTAIVFSKKE